MSRHEWHPWFSRSWLRYPVAQVAHADWAGTSYRFARENGRVVKFWTRKGAQQYADKLNATEEPDHA